MLLYSDLTEWYRLIDPPEDHARDNKKYLECFERATPGARTLLELGSGAGHNAVHLKSSLMCTLTDVSPSMLALSRELNPECEHIIGDMRTLQLGRTFDAVLVHDAVMYMTTRQDLLAAASTAYAHTRPGGAAIFEPDCVRETFKEATDLEGQDDGARSARFMMWTWDPDPADDSYIVDFAFLLRDGLDVRAAHDRHVEGLFPRETWLQTLGSVGYAVEAIPSDPEDGSAPELFLCRRADA